MKFLIPSSVQPNLFIVCNLYPLISRLKVCSIVSKHSVIILKINPSITRLKLVIKSANLTVILRVFTVRMVKILSDF